MGVDMSGNDQVALLLKRRAWLDYAQGIVRAKCPPQVAEQVNAVNVDGDKLVLSVPNQAMATQLRFMLPFLQETLEAEIKGYKGRITGVAIKVRDPEQGKGIEVGPVKYGETYTAHPRARRKIREEAAAEMYRGIQNISNTTLREKLLRIFEEIS